MYNLFEKPFCVGSQNFWRIDLDNWSMNIACTFQTSIMLLLNKRHFSEIFFPRFFRFLTFESISRSSWFHVMCIYICWIDASCGVFDRLCLWVWLIEFLKISLLWIRWFGFYVTIFRSKCLLMNLYFICMLQLFSESLWYVYLNGWNYFITYKYLSYVVFRVIWIT